MLTANHMMKMCSIFDQNGHYDVSDAIFKMATSNLSKGEHLMRSFLEEDKEEPIGGRSMTTDRDRNKLKETATSTLLPGAIEPRQVAKILIESILKKYPNMNEEDAKQQASQIIDSVLMSVDL